jgi:uncharacterized protein involved in copper resistance
MREFVLCAAILIANVAAAPQPEASSDAAAAPAAVDQAKLALAKEWFTRMQTGDIDHSQLNDSGNMSLDADTVKDISTQVAPLGAPVSFVQQSIGPLNGSTSYTYLLTFKNGTKISFILLLDGTGKIAGISVQSG